MNRRSAFVQAARLLQRLPQSWTRPLEVSLVRRYAEGRQANLIFLLALPRSGSTLTYQALVHGLQPLYLSNLWNLLYGVPWVGGQISRRRCLGHESDFRSSHGFVEGLCGPAEGLRFWSYWTGAGLDETTSEPVPEKRLAQRVGYFREVVRALTSPAAPLVGGYLGHALVAERLRAWFPEAVFVRLHRDPLSNAASILRSRMAGSGAWFSVLPKECAAVQGQGLHAEVAAQVYWLNRRLGWLDDDGRTVHLAYEELAADPNAALQRVVEGGNACGLALSAGRPLPASFGHRMASPDDNVDTSCLAEELERLGDEYGPISQSAT